MEEATFGSADSSASSLYVPESVASSAILERRALLVASNRPDSRYLEVSSGARYSVTPLDSIGDMRPVSEAEVVQALLARHVPMPTLVATSELRANRDAGGAGAMQDRDGTIVGSSKLSASVNDDGRQR